MRLLLVELNRFRSRRAVALLVLAAALLVALLAATRIYSTRPVSAADRAHAQAQAARIAQQPSVRHELARCQKHPGRYGGPDTTPADCRAMIVPTAESFLGRPVLSLDQEQRESGPVVVVIVAALLVIVGTTFAGGDWASGSMSNQLLFVPQRGRVWLAKGGAVLVGGLLVSLVIIAGYWLALYLAAESRGIGTGAGVQAAIRGEIGRGVLLAGFAAAGGYALTMLLRHTVGTVALMFAYAVGGEAVLAALPIPGIGRWSLVNNLMGWVVDDFHYYDRSITCGPGETCSQSVALATSSAAAFLGALLLVAAVASFVSFQRRDIP